MRLAPAPSAVGPAALSLQVGQLAGRLLGHVGSRCCARCLAVLTVSGWLCCRAAEKEAAAALANETNPWNTVYGMIEGQHPSGASQKYNDVLLSLKENGKGSS